MTNEHEKRLLSVIAWFQSRNRDVNTSETDDRALEYLYNLIGDIEQAAVANYKERKES